MLLSFPGHRPGLSRRALLGLFESADLPSPAQFRQPDASPKNRADPSLASFFHQAT